MVVVLGVGRVVWLVLGGVIDLIFNEYGWVGRFFCF